MLIGDHAIDEAIANNRWNQEDLAKAERAFANEVAFSENPLQMPKASRMSMAKDLSEAEKNWHATVRGMYMLQSFSIKTYSLLREKLYDEVVHHGNLKPLLPFLILYPAAGFVLGAAKAGVKGATQRTIEKATGKPHDRDALDKFIDNLGDVKEHPWTGALKLYIDSLCTATAMERTKRWTDVALLMMANKDREADARLKYLAGDELEQAVGGLYSDIIKATIGTQTQAIYDYRHTKHPELKKQSAIRDEAQEAEELVPILRNVPFMEKLAHPPKKPTQRRYY